VKGEREKREEEKEKKEGREEVRRKGGQRGWRCPGTQGLDLTVLG
jgi:hypothetical protein